MGTIVFSLYVQFSKKIGNIWLRPDASGKITFQPNQLLQLMICPFKKKLMWEFKNWDLNFPIISLIFGGLFIIIKIIYCYLFG